MEYKSPEDSLNVDTYIKMVGYACLYKASEVHGGEIDLDDITLTVVREGKPRELLKWFEKNDYEVREMYKGIYYVEKDEKLYADSVLQATIKANKAVFRKIRGESEYMC